MFAIRTYVINTCLACFDTALTAACFLFVLRTETARTGEGGWTEVFASPHLVALGCVAGVWLALLFYFRMYHSRRMSSVFADWAVVLRVSLAGFVVLEALAHVFPGLSLPTELLARFVVADFVVLSAARLGVRVLLRELRRRGYNTKNLVVVASAELADRLSEKIMRRSHYGYRIACRLVPASLDSEGEAKFLETFRQALETAHIDDVILAFSLESRTLTACLVDECESRGINVRLVPDLFPLIQTDTQVYDLDGIPLLNARLYPTEFFGYVVLKRFFDLTVSLAVLILLSPLYFIIGLLIELTSPGPVFFVQERVGLNGKKFKMLKFRTMRMNAMLHSETHWTTANDPHVTRLGRWLRRSNLDELPQFLNVLKGDMSIVGPRPERPYFLERFRQEIPDYMLRHYVKCGITGWAQVNGWRGDTSIGDRLAHDLYYIRNWALAFDLKILFLTLTRSFFHRNAY